MEFYQEQTEVTPHPLTSAPDYLALHQYLGPVRTQQL